MPILGIHRWHFTASNIKAVSASKRDDRSMFLYVHENSDDFNLIFPSAAHRNKYALCHILESFKENILLSFFILKSWPNSKKSERL